MKLWYWLVALPFTAKLFIAMILIACLLACIAGYLLAKWCEHERVLEKLEPCKGEEIKTEKP